MQLSFVTNFNEAAVRLQRIEQNLPVKQRALLDALVPEFIAIQEHALWDATPENTRVASWLPEGGDIRTLPDTTTSDVARQGSNQFQSNALIQTYQTKRVRNSSGDTFELSDVLVEGRDTTGKTPIRPMVKNALWSPDLVRYTGGPVGSVKGSVVAPNDYFQKARDNALPAIEAAAARGVAGMADSLFTLS